MTPDWRPRRFQNGEAMVNVIRMSLFLVKSGTGRAVVPEDRVDDGLTKRTEDTRTHKWRNTFFNRRIEQPL